jgi:hypothetical protein
VRRDWSRLQRVVVAATILVVVPIAVPVRSSGGSACPPPGSNGQIRIASDRALKLRILHIKGSLSAQVNNTLIYEQFCQTGCGDGSYMVDLTPHLVAGKNDLSIRWQNADDEGAAAEFELLLADQVIVRRRLRKPPPSDATYTICVKH